MAPQLRRLQDDGRDHLPRRRRAGVPRRALRSGPVQHDRAAEVEESFNSGWTPTIIVEDAECREHRRSQGYLDPKRFVGEMSLARVKDALDRHDYEAAIGLSKEALERTEGDPAREPGPSTGPPWPPTG